MVFPKHYLCAPLSLFLRPLVTSSLISDSLISLFLSAPSLSLYLILSMSDLLPRWFNVRSRLVQYRLSSLHRSNSSPSSTTLANLLTLVCTLICCFDFFFFFFMLGFVFSLDDHQFEV
jgi:hypothetical protein